ncbi:MAG: phospho-N-acetylmuramoyl-pentapeptide-transferase [Dethiobacter sp.]|jgi:phospho-N-acetylmuramoyl-pentapeptide-transferase|nr:phospho-N-acetylmuramoyl-pentapeptide-transferase [Dethiobacter sp.]
MNRMLLQTSLWAFAISLTLAPLFIAVFRRLHFGQQIREEGPRRHLKKAGTPTMGGIVFMLASLPVVFIFAPRTTELFLIVFLSAGNGFVGFIDDYMKVVRRRSLGLKARSKLLGQAALVVVFFIVWRSLGYDTALSIPFTGRDLDLGIYYLPFLIFFVIGFTNAVNLTDGIDGLAAGSAILAFLSYVIIAAMYGAADLAHFNAAMIGATFAFLIYNLHPAKVFMGDVGSLALGGALAAMAVLTKTELFLVIIGGVFVLETLSVIIQVIIFQLTGKRVFRMSPLHHHFELGGRGEWQVVTVFWAVGFIFAVIGLMQLGAL